MGYTSQQAGEFNGAQVEGLKMNILQNIEKSKWLEALELAQLAERDTNIRVNTKAKQVLNILKN